MQVILAKKVFYIAMLLSLPCRNKLYQHKHVHWYNFIHSKVGRQIKYYRFYVQAIPS